MAPRRVARRGRSEFEDDDEADGIRSFQSPATSSSGKRARANGYGSDQTPPTDSPDPEEARLESRRPGRTTNGTSHGSYIYQEGSIVRVKLIDFVTYERAEFFPGPNLNMIIGPNGTGKSSLVCAICLGLGWGPKHLGRAAEFGEFVKHHRPHAIIEIELQGGSGEDNHIIKVKITKDGNGRDWWLNGKKTGLKTIQALCRSLSIQVDNLCQFLPQDKVSEFAGLSPVELLQQTQRAAAPPQMLEWHETLKEYRKEQKALQEQVGENNELLKQQELRMQNLQAQKEQMEERIAVTERIKTLSNTIPFLEYRELQNKGKKLKADSKNAAAYLKELKEATKPALAAVNRKSGYRDRVKLAVSAKEQALRQAEKAAEVVVKKIEALDNDITEIDQEIEATKRTDKQRVDEVQKLRRKIKELEIKAKEDRPEFNPSEWNDKIRAADHRVRDITNQLNDAADENRQLTARGKENRRQHTEAENAISDSRTREGEDILKLESVSPETALAWKWIKANPGEFEQEVYGPAMISCAIKDPKFTAAVESTIDFKSFTAITAQNPRDFEKLGRRLNGKREAGGMGLGDVTLRTIERQLSEVDHPPINADQMRKCGLDGWALDFIDGPEPVLAMLCSRARINSSGIALRQVSESQHQLLVSSNCNAWVSGNTSYRVVSRREYGPDATSTTTKSLNPPRFWTNQPVDNSANSEMQAKLRQLEEEFEALKASSRPIREKINTLTQEKVEAGAESTRLKRSKDEEQRRHGDFMALPSKIDRERAACEALERSGLEVNQEIKKKYVIQDRAFLQRVKRIVEHKTAVETIRSCYLELLDARIRLVEANSDVETLEARNRAVLENIENEQHAVNEIKAGLEAVRTQFHALRPTVEAIMSEADEEHRNYLQKLPEDLTIPDQQAKIAAEESKLEFMQVNNPNAIRDYEARKADFEKLQAKVAGAQERLESLDGKIAKIRNKWEPALNSLVGEISDAFAYNFEQIGCAGEVGIHKDEDFEQWAVQIKVKFRQSESLQILDQHRQSGGERSVSTIFYLMALQSLATSPFRVVDEINQGMDPRNERMVHERMVEIACQEHTSQYFLITPKLLTNLRYDARMRTHVINSGPFVQGDANEIFNVKAQIERKRAIVSARVKSR